MVTADHSVARLIERLAELPTYHVSTRSQLERALEVRDTSPWLFDSSSLRELPLPPCAERASVGFRTPGLLLGFERLSGVLAAPLVYGHDRVTECLKRLMVDSGHDDGLASRILGNSKSIRAVRRNIRRVGRFRDVPVFLFGETGTGKELVANAVHAVSLTIGKMMSINCAAIPEPLLESELFGHEAGAFTGARASRVGLLEAAEGGTVFLDEIGEMPAGAQSKLLRCLEANSFRRVGSNSEQKLKARVVSAMHLAKSARRLSLRRDLFYRLARFTIELPPLRERREDIPKLANHFLENFRREHGGEALELTDSALDALYVHDWPGNVRELRCVIEHAIILSDGEVVTDEVICEACNTRPDLLSSVPPATGPTAAPPIDERVVLVKDMEAKMINAAYLEADGNVSETARILGMARSTLRAKIRRYGVE